MQLVNSFSKDKPSLSQRVLSISPSMMHFSVFIVQFDEQKDQVAVEQVLRVIFIDADRPSAVSSLVDFHANMTTYTLDSIV